MRRALVGDNNDKGGGMNDQQKGGNRDKKGGTDKKRGVQGTMSSSSSSLLSSSSLPSPSISVLELLPTTLAILKHITAMTPGDPPLS